MDTSFCLKCDKRESCKVICKPLEKWLRKEEEKVISTRHRHRKEIVFDPNALERLAERVAFKKKFGWKIKSHQQRD